MASAIPEAVPKPIINPVGYPVSHPVVDKAKVPAPPQASDAKSNNAFTLLVVNDNITNRKVLSAHLQRKGYTVVSADSPRAALTILHEFSIDLVLLDIMTPDDGNLNTLQKIRETYPKTILAVVLITVNDSDEEVVRAFDMGANDYVTKPINLAIVMARIKAQLETLQATRPQASLASPASRHQRSLSSQTSSALPKSDRLSSAGPASLEPANTNARGPSPILPTMPAVPTATPVPLTGQSSLSDRRADQQANQRANQRVNQRANQRDKQQTIQPSVKQTTNSPVGTHLRTKSYPLNHVFSQSGLAKVTLQNNPEPDGSAFCLVETFSPDIKSERLLADLTAVIEEVRSPLKTISQHERIAEVLSFFNQSDSFGWVQAYSEGHVFSEEIGPHQRASAQATGQVIKDILEVLLPFHEQGMVHSSIQPQHLWRSHPSGRVMLINLGLSQRLCAYLANHAIENRKAFTVEHDYMPIEQRIGHPVLSSDLYAVGLIALQLLTGQTTSDLTNMLLSNSSAIANIPTMTSELAQVLSKMLPQEPSERYLSAREALQAVNAIVAN
ncbi:MAG: response regulator [Cyanobacteria bacterium J06634_5]